LQQRPATNVLAGIAEKINKHKQYSIISFNNGRKQGHKPIKAPGAGTFRSHLFSRYKADLKVGDLVEVGFNSNYGQRKNAKYIFLTATLDAAIWGAELAFGEGRERIYLVEATGPIEDDPDLTDRRFPGNPTKSYRSQHPFKVVGEITIWHGHPEEQVKAMKDGLAKLKEQGIQSLNDSM